MIIKKFSALSRSPIFYQLDDFLDVNPIFIKIEGLNIAGSIKLTPAQTFVDSIKESDQFSRKTKIIESSSGNLGIALSIVCRENNIPFTCIIDPNTATKSIELMKLYGANVCMIATPDRNGGYLGSRIHEIHTRLRRDPHLIWTNQYANAMNPRSHYDKTAREILTEFSRVDYLFIGAGTTGTLVGCAAFFKEHLPSTKIIAVDAVGSVTFDSPPCKRYIPGLGTSKKPKIVTLDNVSEIIHISEEDTIDTCHQLVKRHGILLGASTGTVLCGIKQVASRIQKDATIVAISPDMGDKYLETVYNPKWIKHIYYDGINPNSIC